MGDTCPEGKSRSDGLESILQSVVQAGGSPLAAGTVGAFSELVKRFGAALAGICQAELQSAQAAVTLAGAPGGSAGAA